MRVDRLAGGVCFVLYGIESYSVQLVLFECAVRILSPGLIRKNLSTTVPVVNARVR